MLFKVITVEEPQAARHLMVDARSDQNENGLAPVVPRILDFIIEQRDRHAKDGFVANPTSKNAADKGATESIRRMRGRSERNNPIPRFLKALPTPDMS